LEEVMGLEIFSLSWMSWTRKGEKSLFSPGDPKQLETTKRSHHL